jgi:hypothetical protein
LFGAAKGKGHRAKHQENFFAVVAEIVRPVRQKFPIYFAVFRLRTERQMVNRVRLYMPINSSRRNMKIMLVNQILNILVDFLSEKAQLKMFECIHKGGMSEMNDIT